MRGEIGSFYFGFELIKLISELGLDLVELLFKVLLCVLFGQLKLHFK